MSDFGSGIEQFGARHELTGWASKADLRRRIAALEADNERLRAELAAMTKERDNAMMLVEASTREGVLAVAMEEARKWEWVATALQDRIYTLYEATEPNAIEIVLARYQPEEVPDAL